MHEPGLGYCLDSIENPKENERGAVPVIIGDVEEDIERQQAS
jgi:hypothetical protein